MDYQWWDESHLMGANQQAVAAIGGVIGTDPNFASVVLLEHFDGTNGSTAFVDNSNSAHTFTVGSGKSISTTKAQFGPSSMHCSGATTCASGTSADFTYGTGDVTIEGWFNLDAISALQILVDCRNATASAAIPEVYITAANGIALLVNGVNLLASAGSIVTALTWTWFAWSRVSSVSNLYLGTSGTASRVATGTDTTNYILGQVNLGVAFNTGAPLTGYLDDIRITKGVGRYTGTTAAIPTGPYPNS